jgi:hypothetical protein
MVCACHPNYTGKHKWKDCSPGQPGHKARPYLKNNQFKKVWGCVAYQVDHLPAKCEALNSTPNSVKKRKFRCLVIIEFEFRNVVKKKMG